MLLLQRTNNGPQEGSWASLCPQSMHTRGRKQQATDCQQAWALCPDWRPLCTLTDPQAPRAEGRKGRFIKPWRNSSQSHRVLKQVCTCTCVHTQRHTLTTSTVLHHSDSRGCTNPAAVGCESLGAEDCGVLVDSVLELHGKPSSSVSRSSSISGV